MRYRCEKVGNIASEQKAGPFQETPTIPKQWKHQPAVTTTSQITYIVVVAVTAIIVIIIYI